MQVFGVDKAEISSIRWGKHGSDVGGDCRWRDRIGQDREAGVWTFCSVRYLGKVMSVTLHWCKDDLSLKLEGCEAEDKQPTNAIYPATSQADQSTNRPTNHQGLTTQVTT